MNQDNMTRYDLFSLQARYDGTIKRAKVFLKTKTKGKSPSRIPTQRIQYIIEKRGECPLCSILFEGGNHNTEHIHPVSLGGENKSSNKIQICTSCNNSRNLVMQAALGHPPFNKKYPNNWNEVKRFLIWSEITIDEGHEAGKYVPEMQRRFLNYRNGGQDLRKPDRFYGRVSTWEIGDQPKQPSMPSSDEINHISKDHSANKSNKTKQRRTPIWAKIGNYIFGNSGLKEEKSGHELKSTSNTSENQKTTDKKPEHPDNKPTPIESGETTEILADDFIQLIISLIGDDTISMQMLGNRLRTYQKKQGWAEVGTAELMVRCGMKPNYGLQKAIQHFMSEQIDISGNRIRLLKSAQPPKLNETGTAKSKSEKKTKEKKSKGGYAVTNNLNSASTGLRLPKEPADFSRIINWTYDNAIQYDTLTEIIAGLRDAEIVNRSRVRNPLLRMSHVLWPPNIETRDRIWKEVKFPTSRVEFCERIISNCLGEDEYEYQTDWNTEPRFVAQLKLYFSDVIKHLTYHDN
jgi:hypothetical protein